MQTVREFLKEIAVNEGFKEDKMDDKFLLETLDVHGTVVHEGWRDTHRWYIFEQTVTEINGKFIDFYNYIITGDNNASDMGLEYDLDEATFVERKERVVTEIYYE